MSLRPPVSATPAPPPPDALARQLRFFKALALVLLLSLALAVGSFLYARRQGQPVLVLINGKPITTVRNGATAMQILAAAEKAKTGGVVPETAIVRLQKVQLQHLPANTRVDSDLIAKSKLVGALKLNVRAFVILVNGKRSVALPTEEAAQETLHEVKEHFAGMPPNALIVSEPEIVERVSVAKAAVDSARLRPTAAAAASYFWTPPPSKTYQVRRGDTGFAIAVRHHLSFAEFLTANSGHNLNRLKPGDVVNVQKMPLLLTVRVKKQFSRQEPILGGVSGADAGLRSVTYAVTYMNGLEIKRDVVDLATLQKPRVRQAL